MGIIKRGGYQFVTWKGDHPPRHVHVYKHDNEIIIWNLEKQFAIKGRANKRIKKLIKILIKEGKL